jgi:hypothetical protein
MPSTDRPHPEERRQARLEGRMEVGAATYFSSSFAPGGVGTSKTLSVTETNE